MAKQRTPPTEAAKSAMVEHLEHEVAMLRGGHIELRRNNRLNYKRLDRSNPARVVRTSFYEITLLHARLLDEFLRWGEIGKRDDDLWAGDYIPNWAGTSGPLDQVPSLSTSALSVRETINKQLAHVSTARVQQASFRIDTVVDAVVERMRRFAGTQTNSHYAEFAKLREYLAPSWPPPSPE